MPHGDKTKAQLSGELQTLQERERYYRLLVENSLGLMCSHDLDGVLLWINPAAARSLGYRPEDGIGHNLREFLAPSVRHEFEAYLERIRRNASDSGLLRLVARDGGERVWLYRNALYEEPGRAPCVLGHAQDITERLQAEQALRESEARFRMMADTAPVLIWMSGPDGGCTFLSKPRLDFTGRSLDDELGLGWADAVHPDDRARCLDIFTMGVRARTRFELEYRLRRADGVYRWILDIGAPRFASDGGYAGHIGSCIDITARKEAEEERALLLAGEQVLAREQAARAEAEAALRARDELLSAVTHDLKNPLAAIQGWAQALRRYLLASASTDPHSEHNLQAVSSIEAGAGKVARLLDELLDVAQVQAGRPLILDLQPADLAALAQRVVAEAQRRTPHHRIHVDTDAPEIHGVWDPFRLERLLDNLLSNAVKYSPQGGEITLTVARAAGDTVALRVCDEGIGIPAADLPHIFERFHRGSNVAQSPGRGIGLAVVQQIVDAHGGTISVDSRLGAGTTITVELPVTAPDGD
jgi:PAS domain S-box-containing protein